MLSIPAPAKINLTLEVLGKRDDGYHEIRSIAQTINLCDTILINESRQIEFHSGTPEWRAELSLVSKAAAMIGLETGCKKGAAIGVIKNIPLMAGLGGDSSDAATVLSGLNEFWDLGLPLNSLSDLAARLGSDVAFFLHGGTVLCEGRGEITTPLAPFPRMFVVVLVPPVSRTIGKTSKLYNALNPQNYSSGEMTEALIGIITHSEETELNLNEWGIGEERYTDYLFNVFETAAYDAFPCLAACRDTFLETGAPQVHLAGSGPALFSLFPSPQQAEEIFRRLKQQDFECFLTSTRDNPG